MTLLQNNRQNWLNVGFVKRTIDDVTHPLNKIVGFFFFIIVDILDAG